ncbi:MAG: ATP-binding protein [Deltaproteobacteria bacterium]|nr:MAG: ATP-binding protein [Deltaproteobacteria bacterium]
MGVWDKIKPAFWDESKPLADSHIKIFDYARVWKYAVIGAFTIALLPLVIMLLVNHYEYKRVFRPEMKSPFYCLVSNTQRSMASFFSGRKAVLHFISDDIHLEEVSDQKLGEVLAKLKNIYGEFVNLGIIDLKGKQRAYAGPSHLQDGDHSDQVWYKEVKKRGIFVGDIFRGSDGSPYFLIALRYEKNPENSFILQASIDARILEGLVSTLALEIPSMDAFIINKEGILQTSSRSYGNVLERLSLPIASGSTEPQIQEIEKESERPIIVGHSGIQGTPFRFVTVAPREGLTKNLFHLSKRFVVVLSIGILCVLGILLFVVTAFVDHIYESDRRRVAVLHNIQYTNKMASIGRLAAGVAHEINNPLAIINEKAGLLKDLVSMNKDYSHERFLGIVDSILSSVERSRTVTHSLLGFATHIEVRFEIIPLDQVIKQLLVFLGKESEYRRITVNLVVQDNLSPIESDVGQLEQVFLNIINNAFDAVGDGGRIDIELFADGPDMVSVRVTDDGYGISEENLKHIFDPFFSTKGEKGSGLGLSITYGIVQKLGGRLDVKSKKGEGSTFTVTLPTKKKESSFSDEEKDSEGIAGR